MIETVTSVDLPIDEKLMIKKNRICPRIMSEDDASLKRISIVTGIHGDELEGQYVCYELQRRIMEEYDNLQGIVDIYPAMNPIGIDSITRGIPAFDLDMNRLFPGNKDGNMTEYIAAGIMEDVAGSDLVFDIHASNIYLTEIPQIRINELHAETLVPLAKLSNVDFAPISITIFNHLVICMFDKETYSKYANNSFDALTPKGAVNLIILSLEKYFLVISGIFS